MEKSQVCAQGQQQQQYKCLYTVIGAKDTALWAYKGAPAPALKGRAARQGVPQMAQKSAE